LTVTFVCLVSVELEEELPNKWGEIMKSDAESIELAKFALNKLGCPDLREGEGNPDFKPYNLKVLSKEYNKTPDLIAGPNNGNNLDVYIDVHSPDGSMLKRGKSPLKEMADKLNNQIDDLKNKPAGMKLLFPISDFERLYLPEIANPFGKKIRKYGELRQSHMFGFVGIFDGRRAEGDTETIPDSMLIDIILAQYVDFIFLNLQEFSSDFVWRNIISGFHRKVP